MEACTGKELVLNGRTFGYICELRHVRRSTSGVLESLGHTSPGGVLSTKEERAADLDMSRSVQQVIQK
jgi:hypothetical protein